MALLLDTNVVSELARPKPSEKVLRFLGDTDGFISVVTLHELRRGAELLQAEEKRIKLLDWLSGVRATYSSKIIPIDAEIAEKAAVLRAEASKSGRVIHIEDALIAVTASAFSLTLVTRNVRDFETASVDIVNPWE